MNSLTKFVVVIPTKDRHLALKYVSLPSLCKMRIKNFVVWVWDGSSNDLSKQIVEQFSSLLPIYYKKAPRIGSASQRNDAIDDVLSSIPLAEYVLYIDDDSKLSQDAIEGVEETFDRYPDVWGVHIPLHDDAYPYTDKKLRPDGRYSLLSETSEAAPYRFVKSHAVVGALPPENNDESVEWAQGGGMAFRQQVFSDLRMRFNEDLEFFGGYALGEDIFFSTELRCKHNKKIWSAVYGYSRHMESPGGRLDERLRVAAELYNLRLLFDMINEEVKGWRYFWILCRFKAGRLARLGMQCQMYSIKSCWQGFWEARKAYARRQKK